MFAALFTGIGVHLTGLEGADPVHLTLVAPQALHVAEPEIEVFLESGFFFIQMFETGSDQKC